MPLEGLVARRGGPRPARAGPTRVAWVVGLVLASAGPREGPRHRLLHGLRPAVQPGRRLAATPTRHRDAARVVGRTGANLAVVGAVAALVAVLVLPALAVLRLTRVAAGHRRCVAAGRRGARRRLGALLGARRAARLRRAGRLHERRRARRPTRCRRCRPALARRAQFAARSAATASAHTPGRPAAHRPARQGRPVRVRRELRQGRARGIRRSRRGSTRSSTTGTTQLQAAGFSARSGFLTSPTFGGISWLAHSTLQSGLWVDTQRRYDELVETDRFTLSQAFERAGWRTVGIVPSNDRDWPEGDVVLPLRPGLRPAQRRLSRARSSRTPDARPVRPRRLPTPRARADRPAAALGGDRPGVQPHAVDAASRRWSTGPTSATARSSTGMPVRTSTGRVWQRPGTGARRTAESIEYSLSALFSFVQRYGDDDLVLVVLGDHQPARSSRATTPATTCRSRSSPATRRCWTGSPGWGWAGRPATRARRRRSGRWTPSATASSARSARDARDRRGRSRRAARSSVCAPRRAFVAR